MKPLNEVKSMLRVYGQRVNLYCEKKQTKGYGMFYRVYDKDPEQVNPDPGKIGKTITKNYNLWATSVVLFDYIDKIYSKGKEYTVLSGVYDETLGCWRLNVKEEEK